MFDSNIAQIGYETQDGQKLLTAQHLAVPYQVRESIQHALSMCVHQGMRFDESCTWLFSEVTQYAWLTQILSGDENFINTFNDRPEDVEVINELKTDHNTYYTFLTDVVNFEDGATRPQDEKPIDQQIRGSLFSAHIDSLSTWYSERNPGVVNFYMKRGGVMNTPMTIDNIIELR